MPHFELQNLIHALDKSEKIRFRAYCDEGAHYTALFDDLNDTEPCEENHFRESFKSRSYMKNYSYNKGYLFNTLMEAMRTQRQRAGIGKPIRFQVAEWLEEAEYLHEKMFPELCYKRLKKAETKAKENELHEELLKIYRFRIRLLLAAQETGYEAKHDQICALINALSEAILPNKYALLRIKNRLLILSRISPEKRNLIRRKELQEIAVHPLLTGRTSALSFDAKLNRLFSLALLAQMNGDNAQLLAHHEDMYQLWRDHPQFQKSHISDYRNFLNNYLIVCCAANHFDNFAEAVMAVETGPFQSPNEEAEVLQNTLYVRLQYFITLCQWEDAEAVEKKFNQEIEILAQKLIPSRTMAFYMSFARLNLVLGNLGKAIRWNERVLNIGLPGVRPDIRRHALLLSMILYYEAGETQKLENRYRLVTRHFSKAALTFEFERAVLKLLYALPRLTDAALLQARLSDLYERMQELKNDPQEKNALGFAFTKSWLASKAMKKSLRVVIEASL